VFIRHYPYFRLKRVRKERGRRAIGGECVCRKDVAVMFVEIHHDALWVCSCMKEVRFGVVIRAAWDEIWCMREGKDQTHPLLSLNEWWDLGVYAWKKGVLMRWWGCVIGVFLLYFMW
jgi:hypothetical protein